MLSFAPLNASPDIRERVDTARARAESVALTSLFSDPVEELCVPYGLELASPRDPERRGAAARSASGARRAVPRCGR
ncbi:hypothetical protein ACFYSC_33945 [Streptosporangium sp. NPDC004379]|uniref:kynureninase/PvdN C-terminal domain-containing protein n=1 Tax=Streptosporangium sp. NPDC004379 TaxID=3366189 RepID=UPI003693CD66